jgi:leucyl-tRNA synthetase
MFMGPVDQDKAWNDGALNGVKKFLNRVTEIRNQERFNTHNETVESKVHETIRDLTTDLEKLKLNTGVSKLMVLTNVIYEQNACTTEQLEILTLLIAPYATELADESWKFL